jgi:large subunit ribosomal protein L4
VNRKMHRAGLASILSQLAAGRALAWSRPSRSNQPKTKALAQKLKGMGLDNVLIITDAIDDNLHLRRATCRTSNVVTVANAIR